MFIVTSYYYFYKSIHKESDVVLKSVFMGEILKKLLMNIRSHVDRLIGSLPVCN